MKKKLTTLVLAILMTMLFATSGVFATDNIPVDKGTAAESITTVDNSNAAESGAAVDNSSYWTVTVDENDVTDTSAVIVWKAEDEDYRHSDDAVFNIYKTDGEDKELIAENVMSEKAADNLLGTDVKKPLVYTYNNNEEAKDNGKDIPLGYSYTVKNLDSNTPYELIVEKVEEDKDQMTSGSVKFTTKAKTDEEKKDEIKSDKKSEDTTLNTATAADYTISNAQFSNITNTTALLTWDMDRAFTDGAKISINGHAVTAQKNGTGAYSYKYTVTGLNPPKAYNLPVKVVDKSGKTVSNEIIATVDTSYKLSSGEVSGRGAPTTAVFTWKMNRDFTDGSKISINGHVVSARKSDGTYSYNVTGLDPAKSYKIPVKVVDKNGTTVSNVMNVAVDTYYKLSSGTVTSRTATTAVFSWKMNNNLTGGYMVTINGIRVNPTKSGDTYTYNVTGFNPAEAYSIPIKVVDLYGRTVSNVMNVAVDTYYKLSSGTVTSRTPTTAVFSWKMNRALSNGDKVSINGHPVTPTKNGDTYTYNVTGIDPTRGYNMPVKVVDKNGRTMSNTIYFRFDAYYELSAGTIKSRTPTTAVFNWKMKRALSNGDKVSINGHPVTPTKNSDGTYSYNVTGIDPTRGYNMPVKVVDKNGKTISNTIYFRFDAYYELSEGKVTSQTSSTAMFNWKMKRALSNGDKVSINGHPVTPRKNSDGTYSYNVTGFSPGKTYNIPVKVVDSSGRTISNTLYIKVVVEGSIKTMQFQITFGETVTLTDHSDGTTTTTFHQGFTTVTEGNHGGPALDEGFYHFWYNGKMYYVKWFRISSASIASSAFDMTYSTTAAQNYVNSLGISSSTGMLIWVNTYTQKEYIFTGSKNNWRLVNGPWSVATGLPRTPTATGLGHINQKDPNQNGLLYWSVVTTYSFHGKDDSWSVGYPASNGCVRNTNDHAYYIYYNCPIGTAVWVW